jgi:hypothetical protein
MLIVSHAWLRPLPRTDLRTGSPSATLLWLPELACRFSAVIELVLL